MYHYLLATQAGNSQTHHMAVGSTKASRDGFGVAELHTKTNKRGVEHVGGGVSTSVGNVGFHPHRACRSWRAQQHQHRHPPTTNVNPPRHACRRSARRLRVLVAETQGDRNKAVVHHRLDHRRNRVGVVLEADKGLLRNRAQHTLHLPEASPKEKTNLLILSAGEVSACWQRRRRRHGRRCASSK